MLHFAVDQAGKALTHIVGGNHELAVVGRRSGTGQLVKQRCHIRSQFRFTAQNAHVFINSGRDGVVVSGSDMHIAANAVRFFADDQGQLDVGLESLDTVGNMRALPFQYSAPGNVGCFVKTGGDLHQHGDLFALTCSFQQRLDDRRVTAGAVNGELDGQHLRVDGRTL